MTDLTPALTRYETDDLSDAGYVSRSITALVTEVMPSGKHAVAIPSADNFHRVAALALSALPVGDPRKLTWEDVEAARAMGDADMDAADSMDTSPRHAPILWRLAAKIAALLPPPAPAPRG
jgi:hypothetical protein